MLAVQYGVHIQEETGVLEDQALMIASTQDAVPNLAAKDDTTEVIPSSTATLSADKLLETAIKDTCILSGEEDSEESDSSDGLSDEDFHSATEDKVCVLRLPLTETAKFIINNIIFFRRKTRLENERDLPCMPGNLIRLFKGKGKNWFSLWNI